MNHFETLNSFDRLKGLVCIGRVVLRISFETLKYFCPGLAVFLTAQREKNRKKIRGKMNTCANVLLFFEWHSCACVCVCVCVYVCVCAYMCVYICVHMCAHLCVHNGYLT